MANYEMIAEIFQDKSFQQEAASCQTMDDFHQLFNSKGADISVEETIELISKIAQMAQRDELDENMMEDVTGGAAMIAVVGLGCLGVGCIALCAVTAYNTYQELCWSRKHKCKD